MNVEIFTIDSIYQAADPIRPHPPRSQEDGPPPSAQQRSSNDEDEDVPEPSYQGRWPYQPCRHYIMTAREGEAEKRHGKITNAYC